MPILREPGLDKEWKEFQKNGLKEAIKLAKEYLARCAPPASATDNLSRPAYK